jgi:pilus assembly protein CpaF
MSLDQGAPPVRATTVVRPAVPQLSQLDHGRALGSPALVSRTAPDYAVVNELRGRVATRLTDEERKFDLDSADRRELIRSLVHDELEQWVLHETNHGRPAPAVQAEDNLVEAVIAELGGLGRIEPLLLRGDVEDIHFEGCEPTVLRLADGSLVPGPPIASTDEELLRLIQSIGARYDGGQTSREFSSANPVLNVRLKGITELGARLSASMDVVPRPMGTIRLHRHVDVTLDDLHRLGMIDTPMREFLRAAVQIGASIWVTGSPAAGKTTMLRALVNEIPWANVIVTIEDERELGTHLLKRHAVVKTYEQRHPNAEGMGAFTMADALNEALRHSPTRLVVGEVRGAAAAHLLDAVTTGIAGAMCTLHTPNARGVFERMLINAQKAVPSPSRELVMASMAMLDFVVHVDRDRHNSRYVTEILELGNVGDSQYPDATSIFKPGEDGRGRPVPGSLSAPMTTRLADVGFNTAWLRSELSDWPIAHRDRAS